MVLPQDEWQSPLASRYASVEMRTLFSDRNRIGLWRRLWLALAESEHELGLPITSEQLEELKATLDDIDFEKAAAYEAERAAKHANMRRDQRGPWGKEGKDGEERDTSPWGRYQPDASPKPKPKPKSKPSVGVPKVVRLHPDRDKDDT